MNFIKAFLKASHKERIEFFSHLAKKIKQSFIDYWFGHVSVIPEYIHCEDEIKRLYSLSIIVGKHKKGQWFSDIDPKNIQLLIEQIQLNTSRYFRLHINLGCSAFQEYDFSKYQCKLLLGELLKLKDEEFYIED